MPTTKAPKTSKTSKPGLQATSSDVKAARAHRVLTQAELTAEARSRFGEDARRWAFVCPTCYDVADASDFLLAGADPNAVGQRCIGRELGALRGERSRRSPQRGEATRGCDWVAGGLFAGPWIVQIPDSKRPGGYREAPGFALARLPRDRSPEEQTLVDQAWAHRAAAKKTEGTSEGAQE